MAGFYLLLLQFSTLMCGSVLLVRPFLLGGIVFLDMGFEGTVLFFSYVRYVGQS